MKYENKTKSKGGRRLKTKKNAVFETSCQMLILQKMLFFQLLIKKGPTGDLLFPEKSDALCSQIY